MTPNGMIITVAAICLCISSLISGAMTMSGIILVCACSVVGIWDAYADAKFKVNYTVSRWIQQSAIAHPLLLVAIGCLVGHFFCQMEPVVIK